MKRLQRFRKDGWVLCYIPKGYDDRKHLVLFRVLSLDRTHIDGACRYACAIEESDNPTVTEIFWDETDADESYSRAEMFNDVGRTFYHLTEQEAMMLLVEDI